VFAAEHPPPRAERQFQGLIVIERLDRVLKESVPDEVVLVLVVSAEEDQRQGPGGVRAIACDGSLRTFVCEVVLDDVPAAKVPIEL
jgi:hypothetical protein